MVMIPAETLKMTELEHADRLAAVRADRQESNRALIEECAACVPTNWLDPLLSGPEKIADFKDGPAIERLLTAIRQRILALSTGKQTDG